MIEIPLTSSPEQVFSIVILGMSYDVRITLNSRNAVWSIGLSQNGADILSGISLLGGVDIFKQYNIPIENAYVVNIEDQTLDANKENLGVAAKLFILSDEEITSG